MKPYHITASLWLLTLATAPIPPYGVSVVLLLVAGLWMAQDVEDMPPWLRLILWDIPVWLVYATAALVLDIIGLVILVPLSALHAWNPRPSSYYPEPGMPNASRQVYTWDGGWMTWLWGNEEDGVTGPLWWQNHTQAHLGWWPMAWAAYRWSALRNPSNNLRFVPGINPQIVPADIRYRVADLGDWGRYEYVRQGAYAGLWVRFYTKRGTFRFLIGWKLQAADFNGVKDNDYRRPRCGFGVQFKRVSV